MPRIYRKLTFQLFRPVRAPVAPRRPRGHRRPDAVLEEGARVPRRARGSLLPDQVDDTNFKFTALCQLWNGP